jgi:hypothetical protein
VRIDLFEQWVVGMGKLPEGRRIFGDEARYRRATKSYRRRDGSALKTRGRPRFFWQMTTRPPARNLTANNK